MTPTSAAEKFVWSQTQCRSSDPLHSSSHGTRRAGHHRTDLHWEAGQPPPEDTTPTTPAQCSVKPGPLQPPCSVSIATQNHQEITGSGCEHSYVLHLESRWLLAQPQLARTEVEEGCLYLQRAERLNERGYALYLKNTRLDLEGRVWCLSHCEMSQPNLCPASYTRLLVEQQR